MNSLEAWLARTLSLRSAPRVDADHGVGLGVADPDRPRADGQPAAVNPLGADLEGMHHTVAGASLGFS